MGIKQAHLNTSHYPYPKAFPSNGNNWPKTLHSVYSDYPCAQNTNFHWLRVDTLTNIRPFPDSHKSSVCFETIVIFLLSWKLPPLEMRCLRNNVIYIRANSYTFWLFKYVWKFGIIRVDIVNTSTCQMSIWLESEQETYSGFTTPRFVWI